MLPLRVMALTRILFLGDVVGASGRKILATHIPSLRKEFQIDLVIANGENAAHGFGITPSIVKDLLSAGVDVITGGNHTWDKKEGVQAFEEYSKFLVRPANAPLTTPGKGAQIFTTRMGQKVGVINLMGRIFMDPLDCPFVAFDREYEMLKNETPLIFVDIHAEASSEKAAMAWHTDGRASAVVGTHTHVQTSDERIFPRGTGFLTDAGMNGPLESIIGMKKEIILERFLKKMPIKMEVAEGPGPLCGVVFELDSDSGRCLKIHRLLRT